jgi:DNA-binding MarR family transcriptional regulator
MSQKSLQLDNFLPYRLSIASLLVSDVIASAYVRLFALTVPEWRLVAVLAESPAITQQQIGLKTRMDKVTVSRAAMALTTRGLIIRAPNPDDGRSHLLSLSKEGHGLYKLVVPQALSLEKKLFGAIPAEDLQKFSTTLDQIMVAAVAMREVGGQELP